MLRCGMNLQAIDLECNQCQKCAGKSKLIYPFTRDLYNSDDLVMAIKNYIESQTGCTCEKTKIDKNPDLEVYNSRNELICRIEAKYLEGQAFMASRKYIGLYPRETLVVDTPKLLSYFHCKENDRRSGKNIPIFIVWKIDRPCDDIGGIAVFQEIDVLKEIYTRVGEKRYFRRRSASTDYVNRAKMGITDKYHFSLRECRPVEELIDEVNAL